MKIWKLFGLVVLAIVIAGAIYATRLIRRGFSAREQPSHLERAIARTVRNLAIPSSARSEENPWKGLDTPENLKEAREHFADHCATCHANDGSGKTEIGQNLYPKPPDMRLAETQNLTDGELYYIIENGVRLTGMPAWGDPHFIEQDDDSWKLVLFIRHLPHLTPDDEKDMEHFNPKGEMEIEEEQEQPSNGGGASNAPADGQHHHH
ncbi:MAG: c-type cytochrome [Candidatus Acidiferrales bacterium]